MRRITLLVTLLAAFCAAGVYAQPRTLGARRLVVDNGAANRIYVDANNAAVSGLSVSVQPGYVASACAILDLNANTTTSRKLGFLGPRGAEADKVNICDGATPPDGLLIYNTTFSQYEYFHGPSLMWTPIVSGWAITH